MVKYKCGACGKEFEQTQLEILLPRIRCPYCAYKVIYKVRPGIVKKVKAI